MTPSALIYSTSAIQLDIEGPLSGQKLGKQHVAIVDHMALCQKIIQ